jgi:prevent-host-death family protein
MSHASINIHAAKTQLSQLVARAEKGERIVLARNGKPVAQLGPAPRIKPHQISPDDPILNLDQFGFDGPGGKLTNKKIDRLVYGA